MKDFESFQDFTHKLAHYRETEGFPKWSVDDCKTAGYWFELSWRNNRSKTFQYLSGIAWRAMNMTMSELTTWLTKERSVYMNGGSQLWMLVMTNPGIETKLSKEEQDELKVLVLN